MFVDYELALKKAINRLREVLGDSAENPHFIETAPRRGYRFIGALIPPEPTQDNPSDIGEHHVLLPVHGTTNIGRRSVFTQWRILTAVLVLLVGGAAAWLVPRWLHPLAEFKQRRLTANSQELPVIGGVISPSGQYLAFADKTGLYLQQIANGETHILSLPPGFNAVPVAWYPDNSHILARWVEGPKSSRSLWQIPIMGGAPRKLTENGGYASVSRDGSQIAFLRGDNPNQELWVMHGNGEDPRRVAVATPNSSFGEPAWSPDGNRIAFVIETLEPGQWGSTMNIAMLGLGSGQQKIIVSPPATNPDLDVTAQLGPALVWTADNHLIYAVTEPRPNQTDLNLWQVPLDSRGRVTGRALRLTHTPGGVWYLSASANTTRIAYTKSSLAQSVYISSCAQRVPTLAPPNASRSTNGETCPLRGPPTARQ